MSRLIRNLLLVCSPILLAGCQHPIAPSIARSNVSFINPVAAAPAQKAPQRTRTPVTVQLAALDVNAPVGVKQKAASATSGSVPKRTDSQVGQLADGLMLVFTTFTGH
jgi:hypothetical protein